VPPDSYYKEQGQLYSEFVYEELEGAIRTKSSLEQRGFALISSSGVIVTLLLGLSALAVRPPKQLVAPLPLKLMLAGALLAFVLAAALGLATAMPRRADIVDASALHAEIWESWPGWNSAQQKLSWDLTKRRAAVLEDTQRLNLSRGTLLQIAILCQTAGVTIVAIAVALVLFTGL
jgi:hypothetical protein